LFITFKNVFLPLIQLVIQRIYLLLYKKSGYNLAGSYISPIIANIYAGNEKQLLRKEFLQHVR